MTLATPSGWKKGEELPYVAHLGEGRMLAISLPSQWIRAGRDGQPLLLPPAVQAIDRLRALFAARMPLTPGGLVALRTALGLTQSQLASRIGVTQMTISRWECGRSRPSGPTTAKLDRLRRSARRAGVVLEPAS
jgi:DNA-binding transcriptional regulator YiaG